MARNEVRLSGGACRASSVCVLAVIAAAAWSSGARAASPACPDSEAGLKLAPGFCATVFAEDIGHARHLVVAPNGVVYVNTWRGAYFEGSAARGGGFLVALQDTRHSGHADRIVRFGPTGTSGNAGGTGIAYYDGALFAESNDSIVRYELPTGAFIPAKPPQAVVFGMPLGGDHPMHPFAIDAKGWMYVDMGSASNSCQRKNRQPNSAGIDPCVELRTRGGIWRYDANKVRQRFSERERYATGIRNAVGIAVDPQTGDVYSTQHGRDQLSQNWPSLYTPEQGAKWPAEVLLKIEQGGDFGWPECYVDTNQNKLVLAPEYGGDGGRKLGLCAQKSPPAAVFPAHWGPNDVLINGGRNWPARYQHGAFIAFHGSWNRAPFAQGGYNVVFQPLAGAKSSGPCEIFADGFAGGGVAPESARHRPSGLALGTDGALYVSDDVRGRIYRITYAGGDSGSAAATPCPDPGAEPARVSATSAQATALPADVVIPPGASRELVALGERVYQGQVGAAACVGCHGAQGKGGPLGPNLTDRQWLWGDGSVASIKSIIRSGVATPKQYRGAMPPMGGAPLTEEQLEAVAAYLWSISQSADARPPVIPVPAPGARSSQRLLGVVADETAAINKY